MGKGISDLLTTDTTDKSVDGVVMHKKQDAKTVCFDILNEHHSFCTFWNNLYYESDGAWVQLSDDDFSRMAYGVLGTNMRRSAISDLYHLFKNYSIDLTDNSKYISFSDGSVFDMTTLDFTENLTPQQCFYRIKYAPNLAEVRKPTRIKFIHEIAGASDSVYDDIMQSISTIFMANKPTGVIWWLGSGANGKSTISKFLHQIFSGYLCDIDIHGLEDGRDAPILNGKLADIGKESSDSFIEDSKIYKNIGAHEDFSVHKFHSQDTININGNLTYILSANKIPVFSDKTYGARRRTILIRFTQTFADDPTFEERTFTSETVSSLLGQMIYYARLIRDNKGYRWSNSTIKEKTGYDESANTALSYVKESVANGLVGALNYRSIRLHYENWCEINGYNALSRTTLRSELDDAGFALRSFRTGKEDVKKVLMLEGYVPADMSFDGNQYGTAWDTSVQRERISGDDGTIYRANDNTNDETAQLFGGKHE